jgi:hypothetical protein
MRRALAVQALRLLQLRPVLALIFCLRLSAECGYNAPSSSSTLRSPEYGLLHGLVLCMQEYVPARPRTLLSLSYDLYHSLPRCCAQRARFNWSRDGRHYRWERWGVWRKNGDEGDLVKRGQREQERGTRHMILRQLVHAPTPRALPSDPHLFASALHLLASYPSRARAPRIRRFTFAASQTASRSRLRLHTSSRMMRTYYSGVVPFLLARSPGSSVFIFTRTCMTPRNVFAHTTSAHSSVLAPHFSRENPRDEKCGEVGEGEGEGEGVGG